MRKWILASLLTGATLAAGAQDKKVDTTLRAATTKICDCLTKNKTASTKASDMEALAAECITTSALTEFMALAEERHLDLSDQNAGRKLGTEVAMDLLAMKCPAFVDMAMQSAEAKLRKEDKPTAVMGATQSNGGTVLRVDKGDLLSLVVRDNKGVEQRYYWIDRFPGSESFTGAKADALKGNKVIIQWTEREVYSPATGAYRKVKVIQGID